ncbi:MAG: hypothetical protein K2I79_03130, partial [Clostridia bacterium]|nr:hypothetical protein [Clostridia bacterium]
GLYLPAGESVTVTIYDDREITARHTISVIASDGSLLKEVSLSATETVISAEEQGGILLFYIAPLSVDTQLNSLLITIDGAMQTPYYRYGLDSEYDFSGSDQYGDVLATIDGGNIRFYIPCSYLSKYTDIKGAMQWWRSVCAYIKRSISQNRMDERNAPVCVYYTEFSSPDCDVLMPVEDLEKLFDSYALGNTADGLDLMLKISACETAKSGIKTVYASELADLAAYNSYMFHKDYFNIFESAQDKEEVFFSNGYNVLKSINEGISSDEAMKYIFLCFMHSFGNDKTTKFIDTFTERSNYNDIDRIAASAADIFGVDVTKFVSEVRGVNFGDGVKNYVKDYEEYVPVFNYYTRVEEQDNAGLGKGVYFGYEEKIDFRATTQVYN